jgi:CMP-N-acetylneuraminic acid synthetase
LILATICARGGSRGVPRKNIQPLASKPLIVYSVELALACPSIDRVLASTDDPEIAEVARQYGADVPFLRPAELAHDDSPKWPVLQHALRYAERYYGERVDALVDLDVGAPLRIVEDVERCVSELLSGDANVIVTACLADRNPYFNMVELGKEGYARLVKQTPKPVATRQEAPRVYSLNSAVYAIGRDFLLRSEHWSEGRVRIVEMPPERSVDIDRPIDLAFAEFLMQHRRTTWGTE